MGFQSSVNQLLSTSTVIAGGAKHFKEQKLQKDAEIAGLEQQQVAAEEALKSDTIEATAAIAAHEPGFAEKVKDYDLQNLDNDEVNELREEVEAFRTGKLTDDRIQRLQEASAYKGSAKTKSTMLDKAYNAYRELNQRIEATRQLKFSLDSATERLKALKGGK